MPWETADTYWAIAAIVFWIVALVALAVMVWRAFRASPMCSCADSDNCTCGGAWGGCTHPLKGRARWSQDGWIAWCPQCRNVVYLGDDFDAGPPA